MAKKPTKQIRRTPAPRGRKPVSPAPVATAPPPAPPAAPPAPAQTKPRPSARFHRRNASPAERRGADLVRYLRIHLKYPYGERGIQAIEKLAREVAHLANAELNARDAQ